MYVLPREGLCMDTTLEKKMYLMVEILEKDN